MLESPGVLLRAWRQEAGWTQGETADRLGVSVAAVSSWEHDINRIPAAALEQLDFEHGAGGCLTDLIRAIGTPAAFTEIVNGTAVPRPRRHWGHLYPPPPGPRWMWLRPGTGSAVRGYARCGSTGVRFDQDCGPAGIFLTLVHIDPDWPLHVTLAEPGWADFGRGVPPAWLKQPLQPLYEPGAEIFSPGDEIFQFLLEQVALRDRGDPATLIDRLRSLAGPAWNAVETSLLGTDEPPRPEPADEPRQHFTKEGRLALHRSMRQARGLSRADAAALATKVLASGDGAATGCTRPRKVTADQIQNYETGRNSRVGHLPALLDMAYGAFGWSCYEPVPVRRTGPEAWRARFADFWTGPVCVTARPTVPFPDSGPITFTWQRFTTRRHLTPEATAFEFLRKPGHPPLTVHTPPGWTIEAFMGHNPDAQDANSDWLPADEETAQELFDRYIAGMLRTIGKTRADLDRVLGAE